MLSNIIRTVKTHGQVITGTRLWPGEPIVLLTDESENHLGMWDRDNNTLSIRYRGVYDVKGMTIRQIAWRAYQEYHR